MIKKPDLKKIRYKLLRKAAEKMGYRLYDPTSTWMKDPDFLALNCHDVPGIPLDRSFVLFDAARNLTNVPGDIAECGSRHGRSARFILESLDNSVKRQFFVFDSFEGLSEPNKEDNIGKGPAIWKAGDLATPVENFRHNLKDHMDKITIHQGWIPDHFHKVADKKFALVHIDVDLYKPTLDSLEFFYDRVVPGGIIIGDDYGSESCPGAKKAFDEFFAKRPEGLFHVPTMQCMAIKR